MSGAPPAAPARRLADLRLTPADVRALSGQGFVACEPRGRGRRVYKLRFRVEGRQAVWNDVRPRCPSVRALGKHHVASRPDRLGTPAAREVHRVQSAEPGLGPRATAVRRFVQAKMRSEAEMLRVVRVDEQRVVVRGVRKTRRHTPRRRLRRRTGR